MNRKMRSFEMKGEDLIACDNAMRNTSLMFSQCARLGLKILGHDTHREITLGGTKNYISRVEEVFSNAILEKVGKGDHVQGINTLIDLLSHDSVKDKVTELMKEAEII